MRFLFTTNEINLGVLREFSISLKLEEYGPYKVLYEDKDVDLTKTERNWSFIDGYIRNYDVDAKQTEAQTESAIQEVIQKWPAPVNISGSFSLATINKNNFNITLCSDQIGVYPLYYLINDRKVYISNSLILIGSFSNCNFDQAGIVQRILGPEFSNIGSRTILENCKRLLPGEWLNVDFSGKIIDKQYDNSLYQNISSPDLKTANSEKYWSAYKKEVQYCLGNEHKVNVALSGGLDSRIVLGSIPEEKEVSCLTYGEKDYYETKIAARLAKIRKADFENFYQPELYFPSSEILRSYTLKTEAVQLCSWLEILENSSPPTKQPFLLGELCEGLPGRNIKKFSSRNFRQENFLQYYFFKKDYQFDDSTDENFEKWKMKIIDKYERRYNEKRLSKINLKLDRDALLESLNADLNELFKRIEEHQLPFSELYDELFSWYTYTRTRLAKQLLVSNTKYKAYCPALSLNILRETSNIHPNLRLNYRFARKLFELNELKKYGEVPTSQAPWVPFNFPDILKFPVWGLRSIIDAFLIKRMMKKRDLSKRYRLFKSNNWVLVYQNPFMEKNLNEYFEHNHLGEDYFNYLLNQCRRRKEMKEWPFANIEVINASGLNLEIDIIKNSRLNRS